MKRFLPFLIGALLVVSAAASADGGERDSRPVVQWARDARPSEPKLKKAGSPKLDLRKLSKAAPKKRERPEHREPAIERTDLPGAAPTGTPGPVAASSVGPLAAAPAPSASFDGLDFASWGMGHPPDPVGDVGPNHYIQAINTSIGIYDKANGAIVAAFSFDSFMSQGSFGNLCDTDNFGDPIVLYDSFEDRWVISDFAFQLDGAGAVTPPVAYECIAVSKTSDPVTGGWNFYSLEMTDGLNDYPKMGIWPDGIYMSANMFGFAAGGSFQGARVWALNKSQMYSGEPTVKVVSFDVPGLEFTLLPGNARLQTGTPPPGTPNYFVSSWQYLNALTVYKLHVDWDRLALSTFTGPDTPTSATSWPNASVPNAPSLGGNNLDTLPVRAMMQNQYTNLGGAESLWLAHTVRRADTTGFAAPRWYQVNVTGGTVAGSLPQAATWDPDGANVMHRFMPSVAVDRAGDMVLGYSTSSSTTKPAIKYAGRLASDPVNTLGQTEQVLIQGTGTQTGTCGLSPCNRWGDYSAMSLDPDGCTFWYTNEYLAADGQNSLTRIGSFAFPSCTVVGAGGTLSGTVTVTPGGAPLAGATVALGSRSTTTDASGLYSFTGLPAGNYPLETASAAGYGSGSASSVAVTDGGTTTQDFALAAAPTSACATDTTQADFQTGVSTSVDLTTSPGDIVLLDAPVVDQQNTAGTTIGTGFGTPSWTGQTFVAAVTGQLVKVDFQLFCSGCGAAPPNLTLSVRATSGGLPTGPDLATATVSGALFASGGSTWATATLGAPPTLTSGTQYALVLRPTAVPAGSGYFWIRSSPSTYANGQRVLSTDSGATWSSDSTRDYNFRAYVQTGFAPSGTLESSVKDANPAPGSYPTWTTLSWNGSTPASTSVQFQVAASGSSIGPFSFVGPDGTAGTFFTTSGASLSQFDGNRYLKYRAYLATSDSAATPVVNDVAVCFAAVSPDLAITKTDGVATAVPGGSVTYTISAFNPTVAPAAGATVTDTFPAALTCTWTCAGAGGGACTASGAGNLNDTVNLPAGASVTYTAACAVSAAATGTLSNTATIAFAGDPNPADNTATDSDTLAANADLSVTKTDGVATVIPGASTTYTITASNAGPSDAPGATVADTFPASLGCTWTCAGSGGGACTTSGSGNIVDTVNLPAGGSVTYTASCTVSAVASGTLSNTATVAAPAGITDPSPANNAATDADALSPQADLAITKTDGVTTATPGGTVTYTITASNAGPSEVSGASVADTFPASLACTWTCVGAGGAACTAAGSGNIADTVGLPVGGSVTYTASCAVSAAATGSLTNSATVIAPGGVTDPNPANDSATDVDAFGAQADLSVSVTDGVASATPGESVTYTIVAANAGPSDVPGATVTDTFPPALTCTWSCVAAAGGACTASGSGDIADLIDLPVGSSVTYTASCTLDLAASGTLVNAATVAAPGGVTDTSPGNNTATDTDAILALGADVSGTKTVAGSRLVGTTSIYTVVLTNAGPGDQPDNPGAEFTDVLPSGLALASATASSGTAVAAVGTNTVTWSGAIPNGGSVTLTITATILPPAAGTTVTNQGSISFDGDGDGTNESTALTDDPAVAGGSDPTSFEAQLTDYSIPTVGVLGLILLGALQGLLAWALLRNTRSA